MTSKGASPRPEFDFADIIVTMPASLSGVAACTTGVAVLARPPMIVDRVVEVRTETGRWFVFSKSGEDDDPSE